MNKQEIENLQNKISKAIYYWNFPLALSLYEYAFKNKVLRYEYLLFLYKSGNFEKLFALIKDKIKPAWWDDNGELGNFKELKNKLEAVLQEEDLSLKSEILDEGSLISYLINKKIKENKLEFSFTLKCIPDLLKVNALSKAIMMASIIDYFYLCENDFFLNINTRHPLTYKFLVSLQQDFNDTGSEIYFDKFIDKKRDDGLKRFKQDKDKLFQKRVAICFYGALRCDWASNLSELIKDLALPLNADCFLFTWKESYEWYGLSGGGSWTNRVLKKTLAEKAPQVIALNHTFRANFPKTASILSQEFTKSLKDEDLKEFQQANSSLKAFFTEDRSKHHDLYQGTNIYYGQAKSYEIMQKYIKELGKDYDFVFFMRSDWKVFNPPKINDLVKLRPNEIVEMMIEWGQGLGYLYGRKESMGLYAKLWDYRNIMRKYYGFDIYEDNHITQLRWASFMGLHMRKPTTWHLGRSDIIFNSLKIPDVRKEVKEDIKNLRIKNSFNEKTLKEFENFFEALFKEYELIKVEPYHRIIKPNQGAVERVKNHLAYKLGQAIIFCNKNFKGLISMPFVLSFIKAKHKQELKAYKEAILQRPALRLPPLEIYPDYEAALKEKECFTYKLGEAIMRANKAWYKGGYIKFYFEAKKLEKEFKTNKENKNESRN